MLIVGCGVCNRGLITVVGHIGNGFGDGLAGGGLGGSLFGAMASDAFARGAVDVVPPILPAVPVVHIQTGNRWVFDFEPVDQLGLDQGVDEYARFSDRAAQVAGDIFECGKEAVVLVGDGQQVDPGPVQPVAERDDFWVMQRGRVEANPAPSGKPLGGGLAGSERLRV